MEKIAETSKAELLHQLFMSPVDDQCFAAVEKGDENSCSVDFDFAVLGDP